MATAEEAQPPTHCRDDGGNQLPAESLQDAVDRRSAEFERLNRNAFVSRMSQSRNIDLGWKVHRLEAVGLNPKAGEMSTIRRRWVQ